MATPLLSETGYAPIPAGPSTGANGNLSALGPPPPVAQVPRGDPGVVTAAPSHTHGQVGGRLQSFAPRWKSLFPDSDVHRWLAKGITWRFTSPPPLSQVPIYFPTAESQMDNLHAAAQALLDKGATECLPALPPDPGYYSRLFLVPKPTGEFRPIIDLSSLNALIHCEHFKMETPQSIREALQPGEWTFQVDIRDAYLHIPVAPAFRKYLRFTVGTRVFQFKTLPFGLSVAPRIFTLILRPVVAHLRSLGILVHAYLDDWLGRALSRALAVSHGEEVTRLLEFLGWVLNLLKTDLSGTQLPVFLGIEFDLKAALVRPGPDALRDIRQAVLAVKPHTTLTARQLASLTGKLKHWAQYIPRGKLHLRDIQFWTSSRWRQATGRWQDKITTDEELSRFLRWWSLAQRSSGVPLHPPTPVQDMYTDASTAGWGASLGTHSARGGWNPEERKLHINSLEMLAVIRACQSLVRFLSRKTTRVYIDNTTVVAHINKEGGTHSAGLCQLTRKLLRFCDNHQIVLRPVHIAGVRNVKADSLSRTGQTQSSEWSISKQEFRRVSLMLGTPVIDLMATAENRVVSQFLSPVPHPEAWGVNAFEASWPPSGLLYAFPPPSLVSRFLNLLSERRPARMILIASMSPMRPFYPSLLRLALQPPLPVCRSPGMLWQQLQLEASPRLHPQPHLFQLGAWLVSGQ